MNKKGFTLIELIAIIVVLGIIMTIVAVSVSDNVDKSKKESVSELAKNYAESVRSMRANGELNYEPKKDEVLIIPYNQIKILDITNSNATGYGKILPSYCFVGVMNKNNNYLYFINQVDESFHILDRINYNNLSKEDVQASEDILANLAQVTAPLSSFNISYDGNDYALKGVRVEFFANYKKESNLFITSFDLKDIDVNFKGRLSLYNWSNPSETIEMKVEKNELGVLSNKTYTLKKLDANSMWIAVDSNNETLSVGGKILKIDVKGVRSDSVIFDLYLDDELIYDSIDSTVNTTLTGYYTPDSSYLTSNAQIKGNIAAYDNYAVSDIPLATDNEFTINGIKYVITGSKIQYIIVKKVV